MRTAIIVKAAFLISVGIAGGMVRAQGAVLQVQDPWVGQYTNELRNTAANQLAQQLQDAQTRFKLLNEAVNQTKLQLDSRKSWVASNNGWGRPPEDSALIRPAFSDMQKVYQQMQQAGAISHIYSDIAASLEKQYTGIAPLPPKYDLKKFREDSTNMAYTFQQNAKGLMLANKEALQQTAEQTSIPDYLDSGWVQPTFDADGVQTAGLTPVQIQHLTLVMATENVRQMLRFRQEIMNFTSTFSSWLMGQAQKEITQNQMANSEQGQAAEKLILGNPKNPGFKLDKSKNLVRPSQMGFHLKSPYINR